MVWTDWPHKESFILIQMLNIWILIGNYHFYGIPIPNKYSQPTRRPHMSSAAIEWPWIIWCRNVWQLGDRLHFTGSVSLKEERYGHILYTIHVVNQADCDQEIKSLSSHFPTWASFLCHCFLCTFLFMAEPLSSDLSYKFTPYHIIKVHKSYQRYKLGQLDDCLNREVSFKRISWSHDKRMIWHHQKVYWVLKMRVKGWRFYVIVFFP